MSSVIIYIHAQKHKGQYLRNAKSIKHMFTFIALMADLVMEIIFARDIGGLESINENN